MRTFIYSIILFSIFLLGSCEPIEGIEPQKSTDSIEIVKDTIQPTLKGDPVMYNNNNFSNHDEIL